jgi:Fe-S-cluster containining protein
VTETPPGFSFRFRCRRSGNCCARPEGLVRIADADVHRMAAHLGMREKAFRSRYVAASGNRLTEGLGGRCIFLEEGRLASCRVHPVRPERCRSWPFWPELRDGEEALREARRFCPGIEPIRERSRNPA